LFGAGLPACAFFAANIVFVLHSADYAARNMNIQAIRVIRAPTAAKLIPSISKSVSRLGLERSEPFSA
jgi:hypothetical protein